MFLWTAEGEEKKSTGDVQIEDKAETDVDPADVDPDSRMIVDVYEPVMVSCHQDSFIRFWDPYDVSLIVYNWEHKCQIPRYDNHL